MMLNEMLMLVLLADAMEYVANGEACRLAV